MMARRAQAERRGRRAEALAALYLQLKGWRILARRLRLPMIEVDLVAERGDLVAVVEVKWWATPEEALRALPPGALARLRAAAAELAARRSSAGRPRASRVDLVALAPWSWPQHLEDLR